MARATPTSSDQINDYEHPNVAKDRSVTQLPRTVDTDEDVIVDHNDADDCGAKKMPPRNDLKRDDKNR